MAVTGISANRLELLSIADAVAREKNIDKEIVIEAIEEAIQKGAKSRYGAHHDIRAKIDHKTGELSLTRHVTIVPDDWQPEDELEEFNDSAMVRLTDASKRRLHRSGCASRLLDRTCSSEWRSTGPASATGDGMAG